jgi:hypothetical protein
MPSETAIYEWLWAVLEKAWWTLRYFPWHHALDVGVMTILVYQIYIRLLGTKAMRSAIALNGAFFNSQRMLSQYLRNAYFPSEG